MQEESNAVDGPIEGPYAKFFNDPNCPIPMFTKSVVKALVAESIRLQGKVGSYAEPMSDPMKYLREVYFAKIMTIDSASQDTIYGVDEKGQDMAARFPEDEEELEQMQWWDEEEHVGERILVVRGTALPLAEADDVLRELAHDDPFIKRHVPPVVPNMPVTHDKLVAPHYVDYVTKLGSEQGVDQTDGLKGKAKREISDLLEYLEEHRDYRSRQPGMNSLTKRMFMDCGKGSTAWKIPLRGVKAVHGGSGMYGGLTGVGNDLISVDPLLNGVHIEELDPKVLNQRELVYFSDASAPNDTGTGLGILREAEAFAHGVERACIKSRIDRPLPGFVPVNNGRLHNGELFWSKGIPTVPIDVGSRLSEMVEINEKRALVHQGIYTFPEGMGRARVNTIQCNGVKDPYASESISSIKKHLRDQLKTVAFGTLDHSWAEKINMDRVISQGLMDVAYDPGLKIPTRATGYCATASSFSQVIKNIDRLGLSEMQAVNLLRGLRQQHFFKDGHDFKWNSRGATRNWSKVSPEDKMQIAGKMGEVYAGVWKNNSYETAEE